MYFYGSLTKVVHKHDLSAVYSGDWLGNMTIVTNRSPHCINHLFNGGFNVLCLNKRTYKIKLATISFIIKILNLRKNVYFLDLFWCKVEVGSLLWLFFV